jgi:hypothetical protein
MEEDWHHERSKDVETLTDISCIRWDRQGPHPVCEKVRQSTARAVEIGAFSDSVPEPCEGASRVGVGAFFPLKFVTASSEKRI